MRLSKQKVSWSHSCAGTGDLGKYLGRVDLGDKIIYLGIFWGDDIYSILDNLDVVRDCIVGAFCTAFVVYGYDWRKDG